jgi:hypothetical protein
MLLFCKPIAAVPLLLRQQCMCQTTCIDTAHIAPAASVLQSFLRADCASNTVRCNAFRELESAYNCAAIWQTVRMTFNAHTQCRIFLTTLCTCFCSTPPNPCRSCLTSRGLAPLSMPAAGAAVTWTTLGPSSGAGGLTAALCGLLSSAAMKSCSSCCWQASTGAPNFRHVLFCVMILLR